MPGIKQDASNSRREWQVGGNDFENPGLSSFKSDSIHIGDSTTYSQFVFGGYESGFGHFGVGKDPYPGYGKWYNTIVADGVVEPGNKFAFFTATVPISITNLFPPPATFSAVLTTSNNFLRTQYYESHLITQKVSIASGISTVKFCEFNNELGISGDGYFYVPNCEARAFRVLATVNGIQRLSEISSIAFSAYWDISFGLKNFEFCPGGSTFDFIGGSYLSQVSRSSYISTGTIGLSSVPTLEVLTESPGKFIIQVYLTGTFSMIGSAKLTTVDCADINTTYTVPV